MHVVEDYLKCIASHCGCLMQQLTRITVKRITCETARNLFAALYLVAHNVMLLALLQSTGAPPGKLSPATLFFCRIAVDSSAPLNAVRKRTFFDARKVSFAPGLAPNRNLKGTHTFKLYVSVHRTEFIQYTHSISLSYVDFDSCPIDVTYFLRDMFLMKKMFFVHH
jgi:hypothetical protein